MTFYCDFCGKKIVTKYPKRSIRYLQIRSVARLYDEEWDDSVGEPLCEVEFHGHPKCIENTIFSLKDEIITKYRMRVLNWT